MHHRWSPSRRNGTKLNGRHQQRNTQRRSTKTPTTKTPTAKYANKIYTIISETAEESCVIRGGVNNGELDRPSLRLRLPIRPIVLQAMCVGLVRTYSAPTVWWRVRDGPLLMNENIRKKNIQLTICSKY